MIDGDDTANFQAYCVAQAEAGNRYASRFLREGKSALELALAEARKRGLSQELINRVEEKGMLDGSFELTYQGAKRIYERLKGIVEKEGGKFGQDYWEILGKFDPVRDSDLIATGVFCLAPEVREKVTRDLGGIYRVVLNVGSHSRRGYALPERHKRSPVSSSNFYPQNLRDLLVGLPQPESDEDQQYQRMLHVLVRKKAQRDAFPAFKKGEIAALATLEELAASEGNENVRLAYQSLADSYRAYIEFQVTGENPHFADPETGEIGVLPSLHQKIALYHLVREKRFGIWDGGGTGKTAIAVLAQPLIERQLAAEGKPFRRAVVVGPNVAKKAWKKGLVGNERERYLQERQDIAIINGDSKDQSFIDRIAEHKWIVLNYEQLTTRVNGTGKLFIDALVELGVDYAIFDESHNIKALREKTKRGRPTYSAAARVLALNAEYFVEMSATPISNGLNDFAVQQHLLDPVTLPDPNRFMELIEGSPRVLYTFFHERSVRRTSEDINEDLDWTEREMSVELGPTQRAIYDHIVEFRPQGWLQQARKALLDPRLVDPQILERAGLLGRISYRDAAKYKRLEELLASPEGPVASGEKFVIFSTMFREGVTQPGHTGLERKYKNRGLADHYERLKFDKSLGVLLEERLEARFGRKFRIGVIDGTVQRVEDREAIVDRLEDNLDGILCTTETGGESMDLTAANHVYFLDEDYVPDTQQQALWRVLRKGQSRVVEINHLRATNTLDEHNRDYVDKKRIIAKMAMDAVPPTQEEWALLGDTEGRRFGDLVKSSVGGTSIDVYKADVEGIDDFGTKRRTRTARKSGARNPAIYTTTDAQRVMRWIGQDPLDCWKDPKFVDLYIQTLPNLSPRVMHVAKICDLARRAREGEIVFPQRIVSEGSGPSLLYTAYQSLEGVLAKHGLALPEIVDRDTSKPMLDQGSNPNKILACMTGKDSPFADAEFDMVDNESISLLSDAREVHKCLLEANRILRPAGLVELVVKNMRFSPDFYPGMEDLGFEVVSRKNEGFALSTEARRRMKKRHGEHFADSYAAKLANTYLLLARKVGEPRESDPCNYWFETLGVDEETDNIGDLSQMRGVITPGSRKKGAKPPREGRSESFEPTREVVVDRSGNVRSVKRVKK